MNHIHSILSVLILTLKEEISEEIECECTANSGEQSPKSDPVLNMRLNQPTSNSRIIMSK